MRGGEFVGGGRRGDQAAGGATAGLFAGLSLGTRYQFCQAEQPGAYFHAGALKGAHTDFDNHPISIPFEIDHTSHVGEAFPVAHNQQGSTFQLVKQGFHGTCEGSGNKDDVATINLIRVVAEPGLNCVVPNPFPADHMGEVFTEQLIPEHTDHKYSRFVWKCSDGPRHEFGEVVKECGFYFIFAHIDLHGDAAGGRQYKQCEQCDQSNHQIPDQ